MRRQVCRMVKANQSLTAEPGSLASLKSAGPPMVSLMACQTNTPSAKRSNDASQIWLLSAGERERKLGRPNSDLPKSVSTSAGAFEGGGSTHRGNTSAQGVRRQDRNYYTKNNKGRRYEREKGESERWNEGDHCSLNRFLRRERRVREGVRERRITAFVSDIDEQTRKTVHIIRTWPNTWTHTAKYKNQCTNNACCKVISSREALLLLTSKDRSLIILPHSLTLPGAPEISQSSCPTCIGPQ